jgi:subtilisin family serine protease
LLDSARVQFVWLADDDGRLKPDLVAASGVSTVTLGASAFLGSSAAAPHVAGAAALVVDAARRRRHPEDATAVLVTGAADLGVAGPDVQFGWGEARLGAPPDPGCACGGVRAPSAAALLLAMLLLRRR